jgi:hypothetical protein
MYSIEKKDFGYKLTFQGIISQEELQQWLRESKEILSAGPSKFSVFVDMRKMELLPVDAQSSMHEGQTYYKSMGMERSVVIFSSDLTSMQFKLIAKRTGIYAQERYIDASEDPDWEKAGFDWILNGIEPIDKTIKISIQK